MDLKGGQVTRKQSKESSKAMGYEPAPRDFYVPPHLDRSKIHRPRDVISGLLDNLGIEHNIPNCRPEASFTEDGKRFLGDIPLPDGRRRWMCGDIEGRKVIPID